MTALVSVAMVLGIWCVASVVSVPIVALCIRSQARVNARISQELRRQDWLDSLR